MYFYRTVSQILPILLFSFRGLESGCFAFCAASTRASATLQYIAGQRCLQIPSQQATDAPLLIVVCGLAQTVSTYEANLQALSRHRDVLVYEAVGLGPEPPQEEPDRFHNVTLPHQAEQLLTTLQEAYPLALEFDVAGFSLGGRIALALATLVPDKIRKLHVTGVASDRSAAGKVALTCWKDLLQQAPSSDPKALRGFGWAALQATYSPSFLLKQQERLPLWIDGMCRVNTPGGLCALLEQTHPSDREDPWHVVSMAERIRDGTNKVEGSLLVGDLDIMAPVAEAQSLGDLLKWPVDVLPESGHAVPTERPREWRKHLLAFLDCMED